jgi:hypothetical protein
MDGTPRFYTPSLGLSAAMATDHDATVPSHGDVIYPGCAGISQHLRATTAVVHEWKNLGDIRINTEHRHKDTVQYHHTTITLQ